MEELQRRELLLGLQPEDAKENEPGSFMLAQAPDKPRRSSLADIERAVAWCYEEAEAAARDAAAAAADDNGVRPEASEAAEQQRGQQLGAAVAGAGMKGAMDAGVDVAAGSGAEPVSPTAAAMRTPFAAPPTSGSAATAETGVQSQGAAQTGVQSQGTAQTGVQSQGAAPETEAAPTPAPAAAAAVERAEAGAAEGSPPPAAPPPPPQAPLSPQATGATDSSTDLGWANLQRPPRKPGQLDNRISMVCLQRPPPHFTLDEEQCSSHSSSSRRSSNEENANEGVHAHSVTLGDEGVSAHTAAAKAGVQGHSSSSSSGGSSGTTGSYLFSPERPSTIESSSRGDSMSIEVARAKGEGERMWVEGEGSGKEGGMRWSLGRVCHFSLQCALRPAA